MRIKHHLWRVSNGWLLTPESNYTTINADDAPKCAIFKSLKEFAEQYPKRERKRKPKPTKETPNAN